MSTETEPRFPYMRWAHSHGFSSPYSLAQSGCPVPDAGLLGAPPQDRAADRAADLMHPCAEAKPALEARLAELFGTEPERVLATLGASGAMHLVASRWLRAPARVVTELPSYEPFRALPAAGGCSVEVLRRDWEDGWALDPARASRALAGAAPGHLFLANPHNPTGAVSPAEKVAALAGAAARAGGLLVSNEIYMEFARPEERVHAFALAPNAVSIGGLTKAYGLGALRIGWLILGEGLAAERAALEDAAYLAWVDPPTASLRLALDALDHLPELSRAHLAYRAECLPHLARWLAETPGISGPPPTLGLTAFPRIEGVDDTLALARFLADEHGVDVVPGEFFGAPGHLRVGCGVPEETLVEGLARLTAGIQAFRSRG
jgi:aspartate/methionine/tyrosine aminotransferase